MPCESWGRSDCEGHEDVEKLERELCQARWLVLQLASNRRLTGALRQHVENVRRAQLKHRRADRDDYLKAIDDELAHIDDTISQIKQLGGATLNRTLVKRRLALVIEKRTERRRSDADLLQGYWATERRLLKKEDE